MYEIVVYNYIGGVQRRAAKDNLWEEKLIGEKKEEENCCGRNCFGCPQCSCNKTRRKTQTGCKQREDEEEEKCKNGIVIILSGIRLGEEKEDQGERKGGGASQSTLIVTFCEYKRVPFARQTNTIESAMDPVLSEER